MAEAVGVVLLILLVLAIPVISIVALVMTIECARRRCGDLSSRASRRWKRAGAGTAKSLRQPAEPAPADPGG